MSRIGEYLESIAAEAGKLDLNITDTYRSPASRLDVVKATEHLPHRLPDEIVELYLWRNGVWPEGQNSEFCLFPNFFYPPVEVSCATRNALLGKEKSSSKQTVWKPSWYPLFLDLAGSYFTVDLSTSRPQSGHIFKIIPEFPPFIAFSNLENMLLSVLECYKAGAYYLDETGFLEDDIDVSSEIYSRLSGGLAHNR